MLEILTSGTAYNQIAHVWWSRNTQLESTTHKVQTLAATESRFLQEPNHAKSKLDIIATISSSDLSLCGTFTDTGSDGG